MKIIIDAKNVEVKDGKVILNYDSSCVPFEMPFRIVNADGSKLMDDGWVRVTKNHTLNLQRIK